MKILSAIVAALALLPVPAQAHPGHHDWEAAQLAAHFLQSPFHLALLFAVAAAFVAVIRMAYRLPEPKRAKARKKTGKH